MPRHHGGGLLCQPNAMYEAFFDLKQRPFNMTPDPEFLFFTEKHREAFAHLIYGINERRGFIQITGEVGAGKTTLCRALFAEFDENTKIALVLNPFLSDIDLLRTINEELYIDARGETKKQLLDSLSRFLIDQHARGVNVVLVIDEAQNIPEETLEQIRIISNLETVKDKLLQIVLVGQPELREKLSARRMRQLNQRISVRYHLGALNAKETAQYVQHRLRVAGAKDDRPRFTREALEAVHKLTAGVPRRINALCDQALLIAYVRETNTVDRPMIWQARRELEGSRGVRQALIEREGVLRAVWSLAASLAIAVLCGAAVSRYIAQQPLAPVAVASVNAATADPPRDQTFLPPFGVPAPELHALPADVALAATAPQPSIETLSVDDSAAQGIVSASEAVDAPTQAAEAELEPAPPDALELVAAGCFDAHGVARCDDLDDSQYAAAMTALEKHGIPAEDLEQIFARPRPQRAAALALLAAQDGLASASLSLSPAKLRRLGLPAVLELVNDHGERHYVACWMEGGELVVGDPLAGRRPFDPEWLNQCWYGRADIFCPADHVIVRPLGFGAASEQVRRIQVSLRDLGYYAGPPTGWFGRQLEEAVERFQESHFLQVDGVVGKETGVFLYAARLTTPAHEGEALP